MIRRLAILLALVCSALVWSACHSCPFRLLWSIRVGAAMLESCGASAHQDVAAKYMAEVGLWGYNCKFNPAAP